MRQDRWQAITDIFHAALELSVSERAAFVLMASKGDSELRSEVEKLLAADEKAGDYLESPVTASVPPDTGEKPPALRPGDVLCGRFHIVRAIGEGGMGKVFEATDSELSVKVALKQIRPEISTTAEAAARFRQEVRLAHKITHPNVCRTYDLNRDLLKAVDGTAHEIVFLTMEFLEGETLDSKIKRDGPISSDHALEIASQIGSALATAHALGIVHRDIKPANVMLSPMDAGSRQPPRAVIMDFGLARLNPVIMSGELSSLGPTNRPIGTLAYMAPEQLNGRPVSPATDIYSFGLVLFEMITGSRAFPFESLLDGIAHRLSSPPPSARARMPNVSENWERTIRTCLELSPTRRFQNATDVIESLVGRKPTVVSTSPIVRPPAFRISDLHFWRSSRNLWKWMATILAALSLFVLIYRFYLTREQSRVEPGALIYFAEVANRTGESALDNVNELMQASLTQSARINILDRSRVGGILQEMTKSPGDNRDQPTAREVAMRAGAVRVIFATLTKVNGNYRLDVEIEQPDNSPLRYRYHWTESWMWKSEGPASGGYIAPELLQNIREASGWIRSKVGESAYDISRLDTPPEDVTTPSWDALSEYVRARRLSQEGKINDAIEALENAVRIDTKFALAYGDLADVLLTVHREEDGFRAYRKALDPQLERRLSRRERDRIKGMYAIDSWDFETAVEAFKDYQTFYEHDLLGWIYPNYPLRMLGRVDEAVANTRIAIAIGTDKPLLFVHMAILAISQNDLAAAQDWIARARQTGNSEDTEALAGSVAFLEGRYDEAKRIFESLATSQNPRARSRSYERLACLLAERGLYRDAIQALTEGMKEDLAQGNPAAQSTKLTARAQMESKLGDFSALTSDLDQAVKVDHSPESLLSIEAVLGPALQVAPRGALGGMQRFAAGLEKRLPSGDFGAISQIVQLRVKGEVMLAKGNAKAATRLFRELDPLDAPMKSREYLGRALVSLAAAESNSSIRRHLEVEAKDAYGRAALTPPIIWVDPLAYPPGAWRDELHAYVSLARLTSDDSSEASLAQKTFLHLCGDLHNNCSDQKSPIDHLPTE
jgi:serine/threonine protein kinase/tetratricopeptide (TPR) repeat protein